MTQELVDLIILLPGNHLPALLPKEDLERIDKLLFDATNPANPQADQWLKLDTPGGRSRRVNPKAILGWYFQPHVPGAAEQAVELMKKMEKKMPDAGEGENWRGE